MTARQAVGTPYTEPPPRPVCAPPPPKALAVPGGLPTWARNDIDTEITRLREQYAHLADHNKGIET